MHPSPRPVARAAVLSVVVLLSLVLASCAPVPLAPAPPATAQLPEQALAPTPFAPAPLLSPETPAATPTATVAPPGGPAPGAASSAPEAAPPGQTLYEDPSGRFTVPVPASWRVESAAGFVVLRDPEDAIKVYVVVVPGESAEEAIAAAWAVAEPSFSLAPAGATELPSVPGIDETISVSYDAGDQRIVETIGQRVDDQVYVLLFDASMDAVVRRSPQLQIIQTGFTIAGTEQADLANVRPATLTPELLGELEDYISEALEQAHIPGAAVAIVQDGQVAYLKGFGVRELGKDDPVTPDTLMMIGSATKSMTTMMMATLVDEQLMQWDTPAVDVLPTFAVSDPGLTRKITMGNLVCACTGVPRRDLEFLFNASSLTAEDIVASLRSLQFFTGFGEAFQYSNQMVATGGYLAGLAGSGRAGDLYGGYLEQMQQRVLDPIGMSHTTFAFEEVAASPDHATPHGLNATYEYSPLPLSVEQVVIPVAPAGGLWSTARDMARYLITELNEGVNPDGDRVLSAESLRTTWDPQVAVSADTSYGLGWYVDEYKGLQLLHHQGNTAGFTTELAFLPQSDLGIVVLANARASNHFNQAVRFRLFELAFGLPTEHDAQFRFALESMAQMAQDMNAELQPGVDAEQVAPFLGSFTNQALGDITLSMAGDRLVLDAGEFAFELRPRVDETGATDYVADGPPLAGRSFELRPGSGPGAEPTVVLLWLPDDYTFTRE